MHSNLSFLAFLFLTGATAGQPATESVHATRPDLVVLAENYLAAERNRQDEHATAIDVETALAFLTDDVVYEHPAAKARIEGKNILRQGMLAFLGSTRTAHDEIVAKTAAPGVVVLTLNQSFEVERDGVWERHTRQGVKVLEFEGVKIRRIIDYW